MVSRRSSGEPLQGILKLILVVLAASLPDAGRRVVAQELHVIEGIEGGAAQVLKVLGKSPKLPEEVKQKIKGASFGLKVHKYEKKGRSYMTPPAPLSSSGMVDAVRIAGSRSFPVRSADITDAADAVRMEEAGGGCGGTAAPMLAASISLFGGNRFLGALPSSRYQACLVPAAARGASSAVLGLGRGGELASRFQTFSYQVVRGEGLDSVTTKVWLGPVRRLTPATTITLSSNSGFPSRYYVRVTGIRVGRVQVTPAGPTGQQYGTDDLTYLSTNADDPFTYLHTTLYAALKTELLSHYFRNVAPVTPQSGEQLCYGAGTASSLPPISIVFNNDEAAVMNLAWSNLWYKDGPNFCLAILPSSPDKQPVLGSFLQTGMLMTVSRQNALITTLTF